MQTKTKQRMVGALILLALLFIFLPLIFHNAHPLSERQSFSMPAKPSISESMSAPNPVPATIELSPSTEVAPTLTPSAPDALESPSAPKDEASPSMPSQISQKNPIVTTTSHTQAPQKKPIAMQSIDQALANPEAWSVQVATFNNIDNANKLIEQLRAEGLDAYTHPMLDAKGNRLLRVYVGPEVQKKKADELRDQIQQRFHLNAVVRKYIVREE